MGSSTACSAARRASSSRDSSDSGSRTFRNTSIASSSSTRRASTIPAIVPVSNSKLFISWKARSSAYLSASRPSCSARCVSWRDWRIASSSISATRATAVSMIRRSSGSSAVGSVSWGAGGAWATSSCWASDSAIDAVGGSAAAAWSMSCPDGAAGSCTLRTSCACRASASSTFTVGGTGAGSRRTGAGVAFRAFLLCRSNNAKSSQTPLSAANWLHPTRLTMLLQSEY